MQTIKKWTLGVLAVFMAIVLFMGFNSMFWHHWLNPFSHSVKAEAAVSATRPGLVISVQPRVMDHVALVKAVVHNKADARKKLLGMSVNVNTFKVDAVGGIFVSVKNPPNLLKFDAHCQCHSANIDGSQVLVESFLDMDATQNTISVSRGTLDKLGGLIHLGAKEQTGPLKVLLQYSQDEIGDQCAQKAWQVTQQAMELSYKARAQEQFGIDPNLVRITFTGMPAFNRVPPPPKKVDGYKLSISPATCDVMPNALQAVAG